MKIDIIVASKIKPNSELGLIINNYIKRLNSFSLQIIEFNEKNLSHEQINKKIFSYIKKESYIILLDEKANQYSSFDFKQLLITKYKIYNHISFLIAGSDGFLNQYKNKANMQISLSKMTFPHQIARILLIEQLYRAQTMIENHPYHRK